MQIENNSTKNDLLENGKQIESGYDLKGRLYLWKEILRFTLLKIFSSSSDFGPTAAKREYPGR